MRRLALVGALLLPAAAPAGWPGGPVELDLRRATARSAPISLLSVIQGGEPLEWVGSRLAAGDINGDGIADLVLAAPGGTDDRPSRRGRLYVVMGGVAPMRPQIDLRLRRIAGASPGQPPLLASGADVVIEGADDFDHLGRALAVADLDADGFADIVAGAPRADGPGNRRPDCGEVWILYGAASWPARMTLGAAAIPAMRTSVLFGRTPGDGLGSALAIGDLTGDSRPDLVAAAPLADGRSGALAASDAGEVVIVTAGGGPAFPELLDLGDRASAAPRAILQGGGAGAQAGSALAVGDFDGDSVADLAVGARGADGPALQRLDAGAVYLLFGRPAWPGSALEAAADLILTGADVGDLLGSDLAMGDLDADGRADLVAAAEAADGHRNARLDAGDLHLLQGRDRIALEAYRPIPPASGAPAATGPPRLDLASAAGSTVHGADPGDHTGIRAIADLDGDGRADLLLGAEDSSSRRNGRAGGGEVRIVAGGALPLPAAMTADRAGVVIYGPSGNAHLGRSAIAADLNGDGRPELIVAAPQSGLALAGRAWVLDGDWERILRRTEPRR